MQLKKKLEEDRNETYLFVWSKITSYEKDYFITNHSKRNNFISIKENKILVDDVEIDNNSNKTKTNDDQKEEKEEKEERNDKTKKKINNNHFAYI